VEGLEGTRSVSDQIDFDIYAAAQQRADDRVRVTVGRAAQMLRMSRQAVLKYAHAGELLGDEIEGAQMRRGTRVQQWVFAKGEVRRFRQLLEDRRRRRPARAAQLTLPLVRATRAKPRSWRWATFKPRMLKRLPQPSDACRSTTSAPRNAQEKSRVA
jgi:hypothetical protein